MRIRSFARFVLLSTAVATLGCDDATGPVDAGPLRFTARVSPSTIAVGEMASFQLSLVNTGSETITLDFPTGCPMIPYIATESGSIVYPPAGTWGCSEMPAQLQLTPGSYITWFIDVRGVSQPTTGEGGTQLTPGSYRLWGELGSRPNTQGRTLTAELTVVE